MITAGAVLVFLALVALAVGWAAQVASDRTVSLLARVVVPIFVLGFLLILIGVGLDLMEWFR